MSVGIDRLSICMNKILINFCRYSKQDNVKYYNCSSYSIHDSAISRLLMYSYTDNVFKRSDEMPEFTFQKLCNYISVEIQISMQEQQQIGNSESLILYLFLLKLIKIKAVLQY